MSMTLNLFLLLLFYRWLVHNYIKVMIWVHPLINIWTIAWLLVIILSKVIVICLLLLLLIPGIILLLLITLSKLIISGEEIIWVILSFLLNLLLLDLLLRCNEAIFLVGLLVPWFIFRILHFSYCISKWIIILYYWLLELVIYSESYLITILIYTGSELI